MGNLNAFLLMRVQNHFIRAAMLQRAALFLFLCLAGANSGKAQMQRTVLLEEGTNWSCGPCAQLNPLVEAFLESHKGNILQISYHPNWPGSDDPMYVNDPTANQYRVVTYYGISGVPNVTIDGGKRYVPSNPATLESDYQARLAKESPFRITLTHERQGSTMNVHVVVAAEGDVSAYTRMFLRVAAVESEVDTNGRNGEKIFVNPMRQMLPDYTGTALSINRGESQSFDFTYDIRAAYVPERMFEIAFIQTDKTKEVLQAASSKTTIHIADYRTVRTADQPLALSVDANGTSTGGLRVKFVADQGKDWKLMSAGSDLADGVPYASNSTYSVVEGGGYYTSGKLELLSQSGKVIDATAIKIISDRAKLLTLNEDAAMAVFNDAALTAQNFAYVPLTDGEFNGLFNNAIDVHRWPVIVVSGGKTIIDGASKELLRSYSDRGGRLFVHGGEIAFGLADNGSAASNDLDFLSSVLHATYVLDSAGPRTLRGVSGDPISAAFVQPFDFYSGSVEVNQPDQLMPQVGATPVFYYGTGDQIAGIRWESGSRKMAYYGFGLENVAAAQRGEIFRTTIDWLLEGAAVKTEQSGITTVYPNPSSTFATIVLADQQMNTTIEIYDMTGKVCLTLDASAGVIHVPVENLSNGLYHYLAPTTKESGFLTVLH